MVRRGEAGVVLEGVPGAQREAAHAVAAARGRGTARGRRRRARARRWRRGRRARRRCRGRGGRRPRARPPAAAVPADRRGRGPARPPARRARPARRGPRSARGRARWAWRRIRRGSIVPFQWLASRRTTAPTGSPGLGGQPAARRRTSTQRERAPPAASVNATWRPSASGRGSSSSAAGTSSETAGLPCPNGARRSSSSASPSVSASPGTTASTRTCGRRSSGVRTLAAWAANASRNAPTSPRAIVRPAAARWPP